LVTFKATTWNVESFFRPDPEEGDEEELYRRKVGLLAGVIGEISPDAVALQEVGGEGPLADLKDALGGAYPHSEVSTFPDARGIRVAFLSRHEISDKEEVVEFPEGPALDVHDLTEDGTAKPIDRMSRGALRVRVVKEGLEVDLVVCHLKSKLLSFPRPWGTSFVPRDEGERAQVAGIALEKRTAEAVTLRMWANGLLDDEGAIRLLLLGDLNDVPEAQTSLILNGPPGSQIGTGGFDRPDEGDAERLFNLSPLIEEGRRYSRIEEGRKELIDQILASDKMLPIGQDSKRELPEVDSYVDFRERLPSVGTDPSTRVEDPAPDHAPVSASFELPDA
jgi:endonuclease/exonuclease/phosphatase family metal-dependent hydrolase